MTKYTTALGNKICEATATSSIGLRHICKQFRIRYSTITNWIYDESHEMYNKYTRAKEMQLHHLAEEILEIADDSTNDYMEVIMNGKKKIIQNKEAITRSRLRIQARMNILIKLAPLSNRKEKREQEMSGAINLTKTLTPDQLAQMDAYMSQASANQEIYGPPLLQESQAPVAGKDQKKTPVSSPENDFKPASRGYMQYTWDGYIDEYGVRHKQTVRR